MGRIPKKCEFGRFYVGSVGLLRYTQITTRHVVIKAPAIPDRTHSAVSIDGKTAKSQGHNLWYMMFAETPPMNPNNANIPSIFNLSPIVVTLF